MNRLTVSIATLLLVLLFVSFTYAKVLYVLPEVGTNLDDISEELPFYLSEINTLSVERAVHSIDFQRNHPIFRWIRLELPDTENYEETKTRLAAYPEVLVVEEPIIRKTCGKFGLDERTNDPLLAHQWYLDRISAFAAWDELTEADEVVVAVVDNGVDLDHPDLADRLWRNNAEINGRSGVDDDGNGYIDDKYGFDTYQWDGDPTPNSSFEDSHGTHCAGLIAAEQNNGTGIAGVAPNARIMAVRAGAGRSIYNAPQAIVYAAENGANVISMSFSDENGVSQQSQFEQDAIDFAASRGCVLVAAAGNRSQSAIHYPAAYSNVIAVASSDEADYLSSFSNYGYWVDVVAPGSNILSTVIDDYGYMSGTSMATPIISGIVASLKGLHPGLTKNEAVARLQFGSEALMDAQNREINAGRVNFWRTVSADHPVIEITKAILRDPDSVIPQPGEQRLDLDFILHSDIPCDIAIAIQMQDDKLYVNHTEFLNNQQPGEFFLNDIFVQTTPNTIRGRNPITLLLSAQTEDQIWTDEKTVYVSYDSPWRTHYGGVVATVTDFGAIGYFDTKHNIEETQGVRLASERIGYLFLGECLVSDGVRVSDAASNPYSVGEGDRDFVGAFVDSSTTENSHSYSVRMMDTNNIYPLGVTVEQVTTSYENEEYVLFDYGIAKRNSGTISEVTFSMFFDWDIGSYWLNSVGYNESQELSYMYGATGYAGITFLGGDGELAGIHAISSPSYNFNSDDRIRNYLVDGFSNAVAAGEDDYAHIMNVSVPSISVGEFKKICFALVLGKTEAEFLENVGRARDAYFRHSETETEIYPTTIQLVATYPNPFNSNVRMDFILPEKGDFNAVIYNLLGRKVYAFEDIRNKSGRISLNWAGKDDFGKNVASGTYFLNYSSGSAMGTKRLLLLR